VPKLSAGLLLYRWRGAAAEVLLVHPGGPFWRNKDAGAWSIPKGEAEPGDDLLDRAKREFAEETGSVVAGTFDPLTPQRQAGGKLVHAWAVEGDLDADTIVSNSFSLEWPPRSGRQQEFPEVDRAQWFDLPSAREKILKGQIGFLDELEARFAARRSR
jgi:predicted NUDIX family NTP pyrophosphohydrolase